MADAAALTQSVLTAWRGRFPNNAYAWPGAPEDFASTAVKTLEDPIIAAAYEDAAKVFETYASDQIASKRFQSTKKAKAECDLRASIWNDAAAELRKAAAS